MRIKYLSAFYIIITLSVFAQNDKLYLTNLDIFEERISGKIEKVLLSYGLNFRDNEVIYVITSENGAGNNEETPEEVKFLTNIIKKISVQNGIRYTISSGTEIQGDSSYYKIYVKSGGIKTSYNGFKKNKFLGEKTINRNLKAEVNVLITDSRGTNVGEAVILDYKDAIPFDDYEKYESPQFEFTRAVPPKIGTFEDLFFPVLLVAASAAAIVAFFIIRTK